MPQSLPDTTPPKGAFAGQRDVAAVARLLVLLVDSLVARISGR